MACRGIAVLGLLLPLPLLGQASAPDPSAAPRGETRATVVEMLANLAERGEAFTNSDRLAEKIERQMEAAQEPQQRVSLAFAWGKELLHAGQTEKAIEVFLSLRAFFEEPRVNAHPALMRQIGEQLAIAYLRLGEQENCLAMHDPRSCIVPLDREAWHQAQRGARSAQKELTQLLETEKDLGHRWLYNLAAMALGEYPDQVPAALVIPESVFESEGELARFEDKAPMLGVDVVGTAGGVVMEDFDGDGLLDLMVSAWGLREQLRLFINRGAKGFEETTTAAGLEGQFGGLHLIHADYDNDGDRDVFVLRGAWMGTVGRHPNSLLQNQGDGTFVDRTREAGLLSFHPTQTAVWVDFDRDGLLDLFIGNESDRLNTSPCELYRNLGDGTFENVASKVGLDVVGLVKGAAWGDVDGDGLLDLFLSRFDQPNQLWRQVSTEEGLRFAEVAETAGVTRPIKSFPTWFWDVDHDGDLDLLVATFMGFGASSLGVATADFLGHEIPTETTRLFLNRGDGTFEDASERAGLDVLLLAMGAGFGDLDNDGYFDTYFGTGEPNLMSLVPNRMFRNERGQRFQDVTTAGGFGHVQKGHGIAFGDVDHDGDQDVYAVLGGSLSGDTYHNALFVNPGTAAAWVSLELQGTRSNRDAVGARVEVVTRGSDGAQSSYFHTVGLGSSFGSSSLRLEIGLGDAVGIERAEIVWPRGDARQVVEGLELRRFYRVREGQSEPEALDRPPIVWSVARPAGHSH